MPNSPGKVRPLGASARLSIALLSDSVMRGFEAWVIFSTPTAIAASASPAATARHAWRNAMPPDAHAPSTLVQGTPPSPTASPTSPASTSWPVSMPPTKLPR